MNTIHTLSYRRGATLMLAAFLMIVLMAMVAFGVDCGYMLLVRTQLQVAADSSALAAAQVIGSPLTDPTTKAKEYAGYHCAGGRPIQLNNADVEYGTWDATSRQFEPSAALGNAIRITTRLDANHGGQAPTFFGRVLGLNGFDAQAQAIAMGNPRDICFVVDLSGSMNDDTTRGWSDNGNPSGQYGSTEKSMMEQVFSDFGFGAYPGTVESVGEPLGVNSYSKLIASSGPLTKSQVTVKIGGISVTVPIPSAYRIKKSDSSATKKKKAYSWLMDVQIPGIMPNAKPAPNSGSSSSYSYWKSYLDEVVNRNSTIGYRSYVNFMMLNGRDGKPDGSMLTPLSANSSDCPMHSESTAGGTFNFPPSEQPTHAARRSVIAALQEVLKRNSTIPDAAQRDWVSIVTFDKDTTPSNLTPLVPLTSSYTAAMQACTTMQAVAEGSASTATETGLIAGYNHIKPKSQGGQGRENTQKVVVLLTDGMPNLKTSSGSTISSYRSSNPSGNYYGGSSNYNQDAALMQADTMNSGRWKMYPVPLGLAADSDFMDRMARMGGTANDNGESPHSSGDPSEYENELSAIFKKIVDNPQVRMVQ
ncbi:MAG: VWA domain-containing protein [Pirellulales bacterium]|nr:VWA domain-containing protein [Pirellulales bacterium]